MAKTRPEPIDPAVEQSIEKLEALWKQGLQLRGRHFIRARSSKDQGDGSALGVSAQRNHPPHPAASARPDRAYRRNGRHPAGPLLRQGRVVALVR